jgi:hypothetical protein
MIESLESRELFSARGTGVASGVVAIGPLTAEQYAAHLADGGSQQQSPKQAPVLPSPAPPAPNKEPDRDIRYWSNLGNNDEHESTGGWLREDLRESGLW